METLKLFALFGCFVIMKRNVLNKLFVGRFVCKAAILLAVFGTFGSAYAQPDEDVTHLPPAPSDGGASGGSPSPSAAVSNLVTIPSPVPYYIDRGVTMAPMRPLCDFMGVEVQMLDGVLSMTQQRGADASSNRTLTLRIGGHRAQLSERGTTRAVALSLPAETRLGNTFLPVRFIKDCFSVMIGFRARDNALVIRDQRHTGVLAPPVTVEYRGSNASVITITNRVGRALSLRLTGPQYIVLELGRNQSLTRRVRPGVYYYKGGSAGMKARSGSRRLVAGRRATWSWGRR